MSGICLAFLSGSIGLPTATRQIGDDMATLRDIRNAITDSMALDGVDSSDILEFRADFKESVRLADDRCQYEWRLLAYHESTRVISLLPIQRFS
jgi:hypothetical protein